MTQQYSVTEVWSVPYVGTVVNGLIHSYGYDIIVIDSDSHPFDSGSVKVGEPVLLGPDSNGNYQPTVIKSMQRKRCAWYPVDLFHRYSCTTQSSRY